MADHIGNLRKRGSSVSRWRQNIFEDDDENDEDEEEEHYDGNGDNRNLLNVHIEDYIQNHLWDDDNNPKNIERQTRNGTEAFETICRQKRMRSPLYIL